MALIDQIANPKQANIAEVYAQSKAQKVETDKQGELLDIIQQTKGATIRQKRTESKQAVGRATREQQTADLEDTARYFQHANNEESFNQAKNAFFTNKFPGLSEQEQLNKLSEFGLDNTFTERSIKSINNLETAAINNMEHRRTKELLRLKQSFDLRLKSLKGADPVKYQSERAKITNDMHIANQRQDYALADLLQKQLVQVDQKQQAQSREAEQEEFATTLQSIFPSISDEEEPTSQADISLVKEELKNKTEKLGSLDKAARAIEREWVINPQNDSWWDPRGDTQSIRRRTPEELAEYDAMRQIIKNTSQDEASEILQIINAIEKAAMSSATSANPGNQ